MCIRDRDYTSHKYSSYKDRSVGLALRMGYNLNNRLAHGLRYSISRMQLSSADNKGASLVVRDLDGKSVVNSSVGHTLSWSNLDRLFMPTSGSSVHLVQDIAGLGGSAHYFKNQIVGRLFVPLYKKQVVLELAARAGHIRAIGKRKLNLSLIHI